MAESLIRIVIFGALKSWACLPVFVFQVADPVVYIFQLRERELEREINR